MPITTSCDCGRKLNLKDELAGKTVKCPQCGTALKVPDTKSTATAVATPPPRSAPADSRIMPKPPAGKAEDKGAGPKVIMSNFKSLEDFDDAGNAKKKKKVFDDQDKTAHEEGTTGGEMAKIAAEAMKQADERPKARCPGCGRGVKVDDVICMKCGTNIKTGRRIGESAFAITPKKVMIVLGILAICAAGALWHFLKAPSITIHGLTNLQVQTEKLEKEDTLAKLEALVNDADADASRALPHVTNLGLDALPVLSRVATSGTPTARRKAVKLLEIMAFNRFRSEESVAALGTLARESDSTLRDWAAEALFWSGCDIAKNQAYWAAKEEDPQKGTDISKMYPLPFLDCRAQLEKLGVKISVNPKTKSMGDHGRQPAKSAIVPLAGKLLEDFYDAETLQQTKLTRLIQAVRAGRGHLIRKLISYLQPEPCNELGFTPPSSDVGRAWRCLRDVTQRPSRRFDDQKTWWESAGKLQFPKPK